MDNNQPLRRVQVLIIDFSIALCLLNLVIKLFFSRFPSCPCSGREKTRREDSEWMGALTKWNRHRTNEGCLHPAPRPTCIYAPFFGQLSGGSWPHRFQQQQKYFPVTFIVFREDRLDVWALHPLFYFLSLCHLTSNLYSVGAVLRPNLPIAASFLSVQFQIAS